MLCFVCFFFVKQKTAYEMRISDWSSDVCSSDLGCPTTADMLKERQLVETRRTAVKPAQTVLARFNFQERASLAIDGDDVAEVAIGVEHVVVGLTIGGEAYVVQDEVQVVLTIKLGRASCRERVCQKCRYRWSPYH